MAERRSPADSGVSARESEVLALVGERLSNAEIADRLFISVRTVESHVSALLQKLGVGDRRQLASFVAAARDTSDAAAPPALPAPATQLIGRLAERADVEQALAEARAVTICGPGGSGKTRLALDIAHRRAAEEPTWFAELAPARGPGQLRHAVAAALGVIDDPAADRTVEAYLRHRRGVLVLDNCEHVIAAAATLTRDLVRTCPGIRVLATSREPLTVAGERVVRIAGLTDDDATALFLDRAGAAGARLDGDRDPSLARRIATRLDGLPLAIELAAARTATLTLAEIEVRLADQLDLLVGAGSDGEARHQSVRSVIAWSCDLVPPAERAALFDLSVFAGPFDLDGASSLLAHDALEPVDAFVRRSLLVRDADVAGSSRYRMLEPLRQFAHRAIDPGELPALRDRHLAHHARLAGRARRELRTRDSASSMARLRASVDDLRAAVTHAFASDPPTAGRLVADLMWPWFLDGNLVDLHAWTERALDDGGHHPVVVGWLEYGRAAVAISHGDYAVARAAATHQMTIAREAADRELEGIAGGLLGLLAWVDGRPDDAVRHYAAAIEVFRRSGDAWLLATRLALAARASAASGDAGTADRLLDEAIPLAGELAEPFAVGLVHDVAATAALARGDSATAEELAVRSLAGYRAIGYREGVASASTVLGRAVMERGDLVLAAASFEEALEQSLRLGHRGGIAAALECLAGVAARRGDHDGATAAVACADHIRRRIGAPVAPDRADAVERLVDELRDALGERFDATWHRGSRLAPEAVHQVLAAAIPSG